MQRIPKVDNLACKLPFLGHIASKIDLAIHAASKESISYEVSVSKILLSVRTEKRRPIERTNHGFLQLELIEPLSAPFDWLFEFKSPIRLYTDDIAITEKKRSARTFLRTDEILIDVGPIERVQVFAVEHWWECCAVSVFVHNHINSEMLL
jgi:hypothetical protein